MISIKEIFQEEREWQEEPDMTQAELDQYWMWQNAKAGHNKLVYIESLIHTCTLEQHHIDSIEMGVNSMTNKEADEVIFMLKNNQQLTTKDLLKRIQRHEAVKS